MQMHKLRNDKKSKKLQEKYAEALAQHSVDGQVNTTTLIRSEAIPVKDVLKLFVITPKQVKTIHSPPKNSFVWDVKEGWGLEYVEVPVGPIRFFDGRGYYSCARLANGNLVPIERPKNLDTPPEKLYRAINWGNETRVLFSLKSSLLDKLQMGGIVVMVLIMLFFAFVLVS